MGPHEVQLVGPRLWNPADTEAFAAIAVERRYKQGVSIIRQGEPTAVHLILGGWVNVTAARMSGHEIAVSLRGSGELLGPCDRDGQRPTGSTSRSRSMTVRDIDALRADATDERAVG